MTFQKLKREKIIFIISLISVFFIGSVIVIILNPFTEVPSDQYRFLNLASALYRGQLHLDIIDPYAFQYTDDAWFRGVFYYPLGPMPALVYLPFIPVIERFNLWLAQAYSVIFFNVVNVYLLYRIARRILKSTSSALWMTFAYFFATAYIGVFYYTLNSYVSHVFTTLWLLAGINEYLGKRRYWLIGLLCGFALATRIPAGLAIVFYVMSILFHSFSKMRKKILPHVTSAMTNLAVLLIPFIGVIMLLMIYNYARFDNALETGYSFVKMTPGYAARREFGLMSLQHIPHNIKYFLFGLPAIVYSTDGILRFPYVYQNSHGMSIFFTSPILLLLVLTRFKDRNTIKSAVTALLIFLFLMLLWSEGSYQYGYRFALDFMPFLFLILFQIIKNKKQEIGQFMKALIMISACVNLYFILFSLFSNIVTIDDGRSYIFHLF